MTDRLYVIETQNKSGDWVVDGAPPIDETVFLTRPDAENEAEMRQREPWRASDARVTVYVPE